MCPQVGAIIKIQAFFRANKARGEYRMLGKCVGVVGDLFVDYIVDHLTFLSALGHTPPVRGQEVCSLARSG